jgi:hypothetical protein
MKLFVLTFLLFSITAFGASENCFNQGLIDISDLTRAAAIPNCERPDLLMQEKQSQRLRERGREAKSPLCEECRKEFELKQGNRLSASQQNEMRKKAYLDVMYRELEKNMADTMLEIASARQLVFSTSLPKAMVACSSRQWGQGLNKCGRFQNDFLKSKKLGDRLASELAASLAPPPHQIQGILDRSKTNQCGITDQQITFAVNEYMTNSIKSADIKKIKALDIRSDTTRSELLGMLVDAGIDSEVLQSHPFYSSLIKRPTFFKDFFKQIDSNSEQPQLAQLLKAATQSPEFGDHFDQQIAQRCRNAYDTFFSKACEQDLDKGISLGPIENYERLVQLDEDNEDLEYTTNPEAFNRNLQLFAFCHTPPAETNISLREDLNEINNEMPTAYSGISLDQYALDKYKNFSDLGSNICEVKKSGCLEADTRVCKLYEVLNSTSESSSWRLAQTSDPNVNMLLRSMITSPTQPEAKRVLVEYGILPREDGSFQPQPEVPERSTGFYQTQSSAGTGTIARAAVQTPTNTGSGQTQTTTPRSVNRTPASVSNTPPTPSYSTETMPFSQQAELQDINQEILRRLSNRTPAAQAARPQQVREVVREVYRENRRSLPPGGLDAYANYFTAEPPAGQISRPFAEADTRLPPGETPAERRRKERQLAALSGMGQGARAEAGARPGENAAGETKLTVKAPEDRLQLNLNDVLNENILQGPQAEILSSIVKDKKDFVLEVNNLLYKVTFDLESRSFKVHLEQGRTRIQNLSTRLEEFLNGLGQRSATLGGLQSSF